MKKIICIPGTFLVSTTFVVAQTLPRASVILATQTKDIIKNTAGISGLWRCTPDRYLPCLLP